MTDYTMLYLLCGLLAAFIMMLVDILSDDYEITVSRRRVKLRDKAHFAMTQSPKRGHV